MNVSIGHRWENFVEEAVESGRYSSASEVVREGLRLVEEREARLRALTASLAEAIARGGSHTVEDVTEAVRNRLNEGEHARPSGP